MMNPTSPEQVRQNGHLIGQALFKLMLPRLILRTIVIIVAIGFWLFTSVWLRTFGQSLNFDSFHTMGVQTVEMMVRINPYVWWGIIALWAMLIFVVVRTWLRANIAAGRARVVPRDTFARLRAQLSEDGVDVLRWVWGDRDEPFMVGDLQRAHQELRHDRIGRIALVREQSTILDTVPTDRARAPRDAEPHIGSVR